MSTPIILKRNGQEARLASGEVATLKLFFDNDSGDPVSFAGSVSGAGAALATVQTPMIPVGPSGRGALVVTVRGDAGGTHPLFLEVRQGGDLVDPPGRFEVALVVEGAPAPPAPMAGPSPERS